MATWYWVGTVYISAHGVAYEVYVRADEPVTVAGAAAALADAKGALWNPGTVSLLDTGVMLVPPGGPPPGGERLLPVPNPVVEPPAAAEVPVPATEESPT